MLVQGGAAAVLLFAVLAILLGKLLPDRTLDRIEKVHSQMLAEEKTRGDEWRAAAEAQAKRNDVLASQIGELTEVGRTTNALIEGLKRASEQRASRRP